MKVDILGTPYSITVEKYADEPEFARRQIDGFCDGYAKAITLCDMVTYPSFEHEGPETLIPYQKNALRHEIIHAFLFESGLAASSCHTDAWAANEEMVDWIARQGPKIYAAWEQAEAL